MPVSEADSSVSQNQAAQFSNMGLSRMKTELARQVLFLMNPNWEIREVEVGGQRQ